MTFIALSSAKRASENNMIKYKSEPDHLLDHLLPRGMLVSAVKTAQTEDHSAISMLPRCALASIVQSALVSFRIKDIICPRMSGDTVYAAPIHGAVVLLYLIYVSSLAFSTYSVTGNLNEAQP